MLRLKLTLFCVLLLVRADTAGAGEVASRMRLLSRSLQADFTVKRPGATDVPLAIFEFASSDALAKQRVGSAVAELLKREFVGSAPFRLVERSELDRILKEQAIQQTGLTDANSGVQLGKLVGAKSIVTGNVDKLGSVYQVSARLSDVETGDVIAVAVQELPAKLFEEEAHQYLTLVPEEEAIGIYVVGGSVGGGVSLDRTSVTVQGPQGPAMLSLTLPSHPIVVGIGVRYLLRPWLMADGSFQPLAGDYHIKGDVPIPSGLASAEVKLDPTVGTLTFSWVRRLGAGWRVLAGAGGRLSILSAAASGNGAQSDSAPIVTSPQSQGYGASLVFKQSIMVDAVVHGTLEWRSRGRFGVGLAADVYPSPPRIPLLIDDGGKKQPLGHLDLAAMSLTGAIALYF